METSLPNTQVQICLKELKLRTYCSLFVNKKELLTSQIKAKPHHEFPAKLNRKCLEITAHWVLEGNVLTTLNKLDAGMGAA